MKKLFILIPVVSLFVISCNNQNEESKEGEIKEVVESLPGSDSLNQGVCSFNNVLENPPGTIRAAGNTASATYSYTDRGAAMLNSPAIYYRLRQQDEDGKAVYSRVIALKPGKNLSVSLYPNPVNDQLNVMINVMRSEKLELTVSDNMGRVVNRSQQNVIAGSNNISIDLQGVSVGVYYLSVKGEFVNINRKFIRQ